MNGALISVSQLNRYVKSLIEGDNKLKSLFVSGEISNFKVNSFSGHIYFTLKDEQSSIKAVMFKSNATRLRFVPCDGMKVICSCDVNVYEKEGLYQIYVNDLQPDGKGSIVLAYEQLKDNLEKEGLFSVEHKKQIPRFPRKIAVITSNTGAALHDIINILNRRWPLASIIMCPVKVQGEGAVEQMCEALININAYTDCDSIIIGRGGGSIEDLWAFNNETLARCIYASKIPVISAVGHETDFTIADFVADLRAPTPSAAAELATPDIHEIINHLNNIQYTIKKLCNNHIDAYSNRIDVLLKSKALTDSQFYINNNSLILDNLTTSLSNAYNSISKDINDKILTLIAKLDTLNPAKILLRGYSLVEKDGNVIKSIDNTAINDNITVRLSDGRLECTVKNIER